MEDQLIELKNIRILSAKGFYLRLNSYGTTTQSLVQKWLREVHGINIFMSFKPNIKKWDFVPYFMSMSGEEYVKHNNEYRKVNGDRRYDTYEAALEDGIYESLQMIPDIV
jgi:hypothetical protein